MEKHLAQRIHAKKRLQERMNVTVNRSDYRKLLDMILTGKAIYLGRRSNRISFFRLDIEPEPIKVVYDSKRKTIVTVFPLNMPMYANGTGCLEAV